jgi:hypothetical protein
MGLLGRILGRDDTDAFGRPAESAAPPPQRPAAPARRPAPARTAPAPDGERAVLRRSLVGALRAVASKQRAFDDR